ncbi:MAG: hypothetical protein LQ340_006534, partial [Diploschistes diacapsis]
MAIRALPESVGNGRPVKKPKHKAPSAAERQRPRFALAPLDKTPTSAQEPPANPLSPSITVDLTNDNASLSKIATLPVPETVPDANAQPSDPSLEGDTLSDMLPAKLAHLKKQYSFATMSINTGSKIEQKVRVLISHLSRFNFLDSDVKPGVVVLRAKSNTAGKLISVVEIAKRDIESQGRGGKWYQYSRVSGELREIPRNRTKKEQKESVRSVVFSETAGKSFKDWEATKEQLRGGKDKEVAKSAEGMGIGQEDDGDEAFETMIDPEHQHKPQDTKLRNIPILTIYMARVPLPEMKIEF